MRDIERAEPLPFGLNVFKLGSFLAMIQAIPAIIDREARNREGPAAATEEVGDSKAC